MLGQRGMSKPESLGDWHHDCSQVNCLGVVNSIMPFRLHRGKPPLRLAAMFDLAKLPLSWGDGLILFFALAIGHAFADFAWQSQFMATNKNRHLVPKDTDTGRPSSMWIHVLTAHSLVHAGTVWIILGSLKMAWALAFAEFIFHWFIDYVKCDGKTDFNGDQALHYLCKVAYVVAIWAAWVH